MDTEFTSALWGEANAAEMPVTKPSAPTTQSSSQEGTQETTWAVDLHEAIIIYRDSPLTLQVAFLVCVTLVFVLLITKLNHNALSQIPVVGKFLKGEEKPAPAAAEQPKIDHEFINSVGVTFQEMYQQTNSLLMSLANGIEHLGGDLDRICDRLDRTAAVLNQGVIDITDLAVEIRQLRQMMGRGENGS